MKIINPLTYGEAADIVNKCDEDDILIYFDWIDDFKIPVDNYLLFRELTSRDPDENFPMCLSEDSDGNIRLSDLD
jgi:hypothetical protein